MERVRKFLCFVMALIVMVSVLPLGNVVLAAADDYTITASINLDPIDRRDGIWSGDVFYVYEAYKLVIKITETSLGQNQTGRYSFSCDGIVVKSGTIDSSTTSITLTRDETEAFYHESTTGVHNGTYNVAFTTNSGRVVKAFNIVAYDRYTYHCDFLNTYNDSERYFLNVTSVQVSIPDEYRSLISSYSLYSVYGAGSWDSNYYLKEDYHGEAVITVEYPQDLIVDGYVKYNGYGIALISNLGIPLTILYPQTYNDNADNLVVNSSLRPDSNGVYHFNDVTSIPLKQTNTYDALDLKVYRDNQLITHMDSYIPIFTFAYGTEEALSSYGLAYETFNGYLYPGVYRFEIWAPHGNLKIDTITCEVTATGFNSSVTPTMRPIAEPEYEVIKNCLVATPTPVVTPTTPAAPTGSSTTSPATRPTTAPSTVPSVPSSNNGESGVGGFVERLYTIALDRPSDSTGKADWVNRVYTQGATGADVAQGFLFSPEFLGKDMSTADFLAVLYRVFFDRAGDQGGIDYWTTNMNNGMDKQTVIWGFINSTEWANVCLRYGIASGGNGVPNITIEPAPEIIDFATRLYTTCLCRNADSTGLNDWAHRLANRQISGSDAARGFFFSAEFMNDSSIDNAEFINRLYQTFMNRPADTAGFNDWMNRMNNGASREDVFNGFAGSQEWANICSSYGILK